jgi:hypothetical protein
MALHGAQQGPGPPEWGAPTRSYGALRHISEPMVAFFQLDVLKCAPLPAITWRDAHSQHADTISATGPMDMATGKGRCQPAQYTEPYKLCQ